MIIHALYENGVFRPLEPVALPDRSKVEFEPRVISPAAQTEEEALKAIYAIMSESIASGESDVAERHNEHQP